MSLLDQEQVLFDLLFDRNLRDHFVKDGVIALSGYNLNEAERQDFPTIRPEALVLDASMRAGFILSQFCRSYPLSFSLVSSLSQGVEPLRALIDVKTMRTSPLERLKVFGVRLKEWLQQQSFASLQEQALILSIIDAEIGMVWTSAELKKAALQGDLPECVEIHEDWLQWRVAFAPFVSAAVIPFSYGELKAELCAETGAGLWRTLTRQPLSADERLRILRKRDPRILVARAVVAQESRCEPVTEHYTVELPEGFAALLEHVNGTVPVAAILVQLRQVGADEPLLDSVQEGFRQLMQQGMLVFSPD
ncbi:MAG TPA: hypothetical protein PLN04_09740 [Moraxellaceae bacterium]|nr:hypothetical protein [Moraxellaceae bacterium]